MARTIRPQDAQVRLTIRADYDANPGQTYKDLADKFGVNYGTIILAMKRTADEWRALLDGLAAKPAKPRPVPAEIPASRGPGRPRVVKPSVVPDPQAVVAPVLDAGQPPVVIQAPPGPATWAFRSIVLRAKADQGTPTFSFQDASSAAWQPLAGPSFDDVLALFGRDGWACDKKLHH
jgi:hypothetical protein